MKCYDGNATRLCSYKTALMHAAHWKHVQLLCRKRRRGSSIQIRGRLKQFRFPCLNPVDYIIWGLMQKRVYKTPVEATSQSKQHLLDTWSTVSQDISHLNGFHARRLLCSRSASTSITTCAIRSVISHRPQRVLPCLSVTLSNIISLLIYSATFVSSMSYHVLSHK